jgi:hypothetical protein
MDNLFDHIADLPVQHVDGSLIAAEIGRVVEAIRQYDPLIEVQWIPRDARGEGDAAFRLVHNPVGGRPYVMFYVQTEDEFDHRVLKRIMMNDQARTGGKTTMSEFEAHRRAQEAVKQQKFRDQMEEANDIAFHVFKSKLNTYRVNKDLVIKE